MKESSQRMARCAMTTALSVVVMLVLGLTGIGTYAGPLVASMLLVSIQREYGTPTTLTVWIATGLLALILVTDREEAVVYLTVFGWYPALRPWFQRLPGPLSMAAKAAVFNAAAIGSYALMIPILGLTEEMSSPPLLAFLLVMGNIMFVMVDVIIIPRSLPVFEQRLSKLFRR